MISTHFYEAYEQTTCFPTRCNIASLNGMDLDKGKQQMTAPVSIIIKSPLAEDSRTPKFVGLDHSFISDRLDEATQQNYKKQIEKLNPGRSDLCQRKFWNIQYFKDSNLPVIVGTL